MAFVRERSSARGTAQLAGCKTEISRYVIGGADTAEQAAARQREERRRRVGELNRKMLQDRRPTLMVTEQTGRREEKGADEGKSEGAGAPGPSQPPPREPGQGQETRGTIRENGGAGSQARRLRCFWADEAILVMMERAQNELPNPTAKPTAVDAADLGLEQLAVAITEAGPVADVLGPKADKLGFGPLTLVDATRKRLNRQGFFVLRISYGNYNQEDKFRTAAGAAVKATAWLALIAAGVRGLPP